MSRLAMPPMQPILEGQPAANLDDTHAGCGSDFAIQRRSQACGWVIEAHHVEDVCGLTTELEDPRLTDVDVAEDSQVDTAVAGSAQ